MKTEQKEDVLEEPHYALVIKKRLKYRLHQFVVSKFIHGDRS